MAATESRAGGARAGPDRRSRPAVRGAPRAPAPAAGERGPLHAPRGHSRSRSHAGSALHVRRAVRSAASRCRARRSLTRSHGSAASGPTTAPASRGRCHRIAALRNRRGDVVGLTCRVGRAVVGTIDIVRDVFARGESVLLLGGPASARRPAARGGARARRRARQACGGRRHVERDRRRRRHPPPRHRRPAAAGAVPGAAARGHDRGGREPHAGGDRDRRDRHPGRGARRAHDRRAGRPADRHRARHDAREPAREPDPRDLVGGIEAVTLCDEEARRRRTQKTVLERKAPPTFDVLIEIQSHRRFAVRDNVAEAVDALLAGRPEPPEIRERREDGSVEIHTPPPTVRPSARGRDASHREAPRRIFPYGVSFSRLERAVRALGCAHRAVTPHSQGCRSGADPTEPAPQGPAEARRSAAPRPPSWPSTATRRRRSRSCCRGSSRSSTPTRRRVARRSAPPRPSWRRIGRWCCRRGPRPSGGSSTCWRRSAASVRRAAVASRFAP